MSFNRFFTRSAGLSLAVVLLGGFAQESVASTPMSSAAGATLAPGDVAPGRLFARESAASISAGRVSVSNPVSPQQPLAEPPGPETRRSKSTMLHVAPGSGPTQLSLPVTAPEEAWVMLIPKGTDAKVGEESLREVQLLDPKGRRVDPRAARAGNAMLGADEARMKAEGISRPVSMLRLERDMGRGLYKLQVGRQSAAVGLAVEVREPASSIELALTASTMQLFPGEEGYVTVGLQSAEPVQGVRYEASLYNPRFEKVRTVPVVKVGSEHRAMVSRVLSERDEPGAWVLEVR
ncbi:MAG TPA: hypothetical protein VLQ93_13185, partial [Myxococcaceae bacterium]|nr:hypothetical protein [Myxococcaceae bacterium]